MKKHGNNILRTWKMVFGKWQYILLALIVALMFYSLNIVFFHWGNFKSFYSIFGFWGFIENFIDLLIGFPGATPIHAGYGALVISILTGMLIALLTFRFRILRDPGKKLGFWTGLGVFFGVFVSGCASCGLGLVAALGVASSFAFLPFGGHELSIIAIMILLGVLLRISATFLQCKPVK